MTTLKKSSGALRAVPFTAVTMEDAFWAARMEVNRRATLPIEFRQCEETGRIDAWTWKKGQPNEPHIFWDSDVAKWIEAAAYSLATHPDRVLEDKIDRVVALMAAAQDKDGYLNSHYLRVEPEKRWTNLRDCHELYCAGHLMEGAVAYWQATGKRAFLDVMCRYADHIGNVFGRGEGQKRGYCGHPEVELAVMKLYRATGERRYLDLAEYFVDERGRSPSYFDEEARKRGEDPARFHFNTHSYMQVQADKPVRKQGQVLGHAVRAMYLYAGAADVAAECGDAGMLAALRRLWDDVTLKKMHVTGGIGPSCRNEGFTFDHDLPNESAYDETCAGIALVFWAARMLNLDPDGRYADVMEQALFNNVAAGVSLDGKRFFYANPLAAHPGVDPHGGLVKEDFHYRRSEWFGCACCPPNVARLFASIGGYLYSQTESEVRVHLYAAGRTTVKLDSGEVNLRQETEYPWDGRVKISLGLGKPAAFTLALRIPGWCRKALLRVNGKAVKGAAVKGYARVARRWEDGDCVQLDLAMPVERMEAHPRVRQDAGRVALQRGPVVYCLEEVDNGKNLADVVLPAGATFAAVREPRLLGGVVALRGTGWKRDEAGWKGALYRPAESRRKKVKIKAVPYAVWANRQAGEMAVWVRGE